MSATAVPACREVGAASTPCRQAVASSPGRNLLEERSSSCRAMVALLSPPFLWTLTVHSSMLVDQHRMPAAAVPIRFDPPYPSLTKSRPKDSCSPYGRYGWLHRITSAQLIRSPNCKHAFVSGSQILLLMTHVILVTTHQKISPLQFRCRCAAL